MGRPGVGGIQTTAHRNIQIEGFHMPPGGAGMGLAPLRVYNNIVAQGGALNQNDVQCVNAFGGIGAVINANSGDFNNNVRITEV